MPKLDYLQQRKLNPADDLRETLTHLEERLVRIRNIEPDRAAEFMLDLDRACILFEQLEAAGLELRAEQGRFKAIQARVLQRAGSLLKALGGPAALARLRPQPAPPEERWWWSIDRAVAARKKQARLRLMVALGLLLAGITGVIVAFKTVLAPSPEALARVEAENAAFAALDESNPAAALAALEEGLLVTGDEPGLLIMQGVVQRAMGHPDEAERSFSRAQAALDDPLYFYLARGQVELRLTEPQNTEADARAALALNENSARAWLLLGNSLEMQDEKMQALLAYEQAGNLAMDSGDNEVYVIARMALARLSGFQ